MGGTRYLVGIALSVAALVAACGDDPTGLNGGGTPRGSNGGGEEGTTPGAPSTSSDGTNNGGQPGAPASGAGPTPVDPNPAPNTPAKAYFVANVFPSLSQTCGTCHFVGPGPAWIKQSDADVSYKMMFQLGYVSPQSRILLKGPHEGTGPALTPDQTTKFTAWVNMELQASGGKAPPNVLAKIGACFDKTKFDAMGLQNLRTIQRTNNNNTNNVTPWNENANNCTGCNNTPCRNCHSGDDATNYVMAIGNPNLPATYTFDNSKLTTPTYVQKYFGVSATGDPIASNAIQIKADATSKDKAYTHPYFKIDANTQANISAFVDAAITKYKATNGTCQ
jgi:hypothetical protein